MSQLEQKNREYGLHQFLRKVDEYDVDPLELPVHLAGSEYWDHMHPDRRDRILGGMLRYVFNRAKEGVPLYANNPDWSRVSPHDITSITDLGELPIISKDSVPGTGTSNTQGIRGFRNLALENPRVLVPRNLEYLIRKQENANPDFEKIKTLYDGNSVLQFGSGGTKGNSTITELTYLSVEAESYALARGLKQNGFREGQSIACFYAPNHKGGLQLERAADIMGMDFHSKAKIFSTLRQESTKYQKAIDRFTDGLQKSQQEGFKKEGEVLLLKYGPTVRKAIRSYIKNNKIEVIEAVQPGAEITSNVKGNALAFMTIYEEDPKAFESTKHVFLTGFTVPEMAYETLTKDGKRVSTTWGSTETMALATYRQDDDSDNVNNLTAIPFPTAGIVAKYKERGLKKPQLELVKEENEGLLLVTSLLGAGSTYINYMIGDVAMKTKRGYRDIHRLQSAKIAGSCAADALSI